MKRTALVALLAMSWLLLTASQASAQYTYNVNQFGNITTISGSDGTYGTGIRMGNMQTWNFNNGAGFTRYDYPNMTMYNFNNGGSMTVNRFGNMTTVTTSNGGYGTSFQYPWGSTTTWSSPCGYPNVYGNHRRRGW